MATGYAHGKDDLLVRLRRIEGQVRGLQRQIESDTYCIDVLTQISAVSSALRSVALGLVDDHLRHCVAEAASSDGDADEVLAEATAAIGRLLRT
jgi:CsoR family transcriptional regulator, copper-sensing transcriptional repressor